MKEQDQILRFLFEEHAVRGQHISLDASWRKIVEQSDAEGVAQALLGQALTAAAMLIETLKINGSISLQIRGGGAIHLLVAEANSERTIRGIVRQTRDPQALQTLAEIFGSEKLVITIKDGNAKPHQGIVPLNGDNLAEALQTYFNQSEQLPTRLWLASNEESCGGLLLQKLPEQVDDPDAWNRIGLLAETIRDEELLTLSSEQLLHRLFHEEKLRVFEPSTIEFACTCSRERTRDMLISLGEAEINDIMEHQQQASITCEFCNSQYHFDNVDLELLFKQSDTILTSSTEH